MCVYVFVYVQTHTHTPGLWIFLNLSVDHTHLLWNDSQFLPMALQGKVVQALSKVFLYCIQLLGFGPQFKLSHILPVSVVHILQGIVKAALLFSLGSWWVFLFHFLMSLIFPMYPFLQSVCFSVLSSLIYKVQVVIIPTLSGCCVD